MTEFTELRDRAKVAGINVFHMDTDALKAALAGHAADNDPLGPDPRADRPTTREETGRAARIPLGTARLKLDYPKRPGYHRHWFNDTGGRIHDALAAGYAHVEERLDGRDMKVSRRVGVNEDGSPKMGYLMEIRQEFHDEDQAAKQGVIDETEAAITRDVEPGEGTYRPAEGASMRVET